MATFTVLVGIGIFFFFFSGEEAPRAGAVLPLRKQSEDGGLAQLLSEDSEFHFHYFLFPSTPRSQLRESWIGP